MSLSIKDPRQFSQIYPDSNMLINQSLHDLSRNEDDALMCALIEDTLKQHQDQTLSVGFNLAPNLEVANYIWDSMQKVINKSQTSKTYYFAMPVILVVGSKAQVKLDNSLNTLAIKELFTKHQVFANDFTIYDNLYDVNSLAKLKPSQLYNYSQNEFSTANVINSLSNSEIINMGEEVHLRFIVGCTINAENNFSNANFNKSSMELMQIINDKIKQDSATIFPIIFAPCNMSEATVVGNYYKNELNITFKLSNSVKKYRLSGKTPYVLLTTSNGVIQISLKIKEDAQVNEVFEWSLSFVDSFVKVSQTLELLLSDMRLEITYDGELSA